jgi:hypothetical protein
MADVFISYRRDEGLAVKLLHTALVERFDVFFDLDRRSIKPGEPFPDKIRSALSDSRVVIVVIGQAWVSDKNLARLADPNDWVKSEIESALAAGVRVIPVLFDNVLPAKLAALNEPLRQLASLSRRHLWLASPAERPSNGRRRALAGKTPASLGSCCAVQLFPLKSVSLCL